MANFEFEEFEPEFEMIAAGKGFVGIIDDDHPTEDHQTTKEVCTGKEEAIIWRIRYNCIR